MCAVLRPVRRQHTVTKRILKEFAGDDGRLAVFDQSRRHRVLRSPGAGVFTSQFDTYDPRGAENRWNIFENMFPRTLSRAKAKTALGEPKTVVNIKDMLALHWMRSAAAVVARERILQQVDQTHREELLRQRPQLLAQALLKETGMIAASILRWNGSTTPSTTASSPTRQPSGTATETR